MISDVPLRKLWDRHVQLRGKLVPGTLYNLQMFGNVFCRFCDGKPLDAKTISEWSLQLCNGRQESSAQNLNRAVKAFLKWLKHAGYLSEDLSGFITNLPATSFKPLKVFTDEEYEMMKAWCTKYERYPFYQCYLWLIILAYNTGLRLIDCCHIRWCHVHLKIDAQGYIDIPPIQTVRTRRRCVIPIIPFTDLHEWLLKLKAVEHRRYRRPDGITDFVHQDAPSLYTRRFRNEFHRIMTKSHVPPMGRSFKTFRDTFIWKLANAGVPRAAIIKMTGTVKIDEYLNHFKVDPRTLSNELQKAIDYATPTTTTGDSAGNPGGLREIRDSTAA